MQESGLTEIVPLIFWPSSIWGQNPVFSHPEFLSTHRRERLKSDGH